MSNTNQLYCSAPWNGIAIMEDGKVRTCCEGRSTITDLRISNVESIESSPVLARIRANMQSGRPDPTNCANCLLKEKKDGLAPLRQYYQTYFPHVDQDNNKLKFIDVRWNNTCNLGCIYCSSKFSSTWADRLSQANASPTKEYQDDLLHWILDRVEHVEEVMLVGGEPMLTKQNYTLLKHLPKTCKISIVTNLSYELESLPCIDILIDRDPDLLVWNISAENVGDRYEYIRSGSQWKQFEKNLKFLNANCPGTQRLAMVYFLLSAFDLESTVDYFFNQGVKKFGVQPLVGNQILDVGLMPQEIRQQALDILKQTIARYQGQIEPDFLETVWLKYGDKIEHHLETVEPLKIITLEEFQSQIEWYNRWGPKQFQDLWPDLHTLLKQSLR